MSTEQTQAEAATQPALLPDLARARAREVRERRRADQAETDAAATTAEALVAKVLVDVPLAHLDRPFDYLVPEKWADTAVPGARVKVRFAGQDVDGFILERAQGSEHRGRLAPLRRVVSPEPVLSPEVARLSGSVAARYAGTRSDVLRLAVPPRHARVEKRPTPDVPETTMDVAAAAAAWSSYVGGPELVRQVGAGAQPRGVWTALPGEDWPGLLALAAAATYASGRGVILCLPDRKDVARVDAALGRTLGIGRHVVLTAEQGPAARYAAFLAVARGAVRVVVGTRAAAFAPVRRLGLVAIWDDGDDLHSDPHAPYPHTREVLLLRAHEQPCAALVGGFARTVEGEYLLLTGWAREIAAQRATLRRTGPHVSVAGATDTDLERDPFARTARLPRQALQAVRAGLERGPVLLQTPRSGYVSALACDRCRTPARCTTCAGPLGLPASHRPPTCRWCGEEHRGWACAECGGHGLRAPVVGDRRTAEEVGRAFPGVPVRTSSGGHVLAEVGDDPAIVVATPGAEPVTKAGYAAVVLLDAWLMLARPDLRTAEESLRRWLNAAALARPGPEGGRVVVVGESADPTIQALVRWDPAGFAARELTERQATHLPPASRLATLAGPEAAVTSALAMLELPAGAEVLGPVPVPPTSGAGNPPAGGGAGGSGDGDGGAAVRAVVRVPRAVGPRLSRTLVEMQGVRDAKKMASVRVQVDPVALG